MRINSSCAQAVGLEYLTFANAARYCHLDLPCAYFSHQQVESRLYWLKIQSVSPVSEAAHYIFDLQTPIMDLAKTLIRSVARAFYDIEHVLVIDALMVHSAYALYHSLVVAHLSHQPTDKLCT